VTALRSCPQRSTSHVRLRQIVGRVADAHLDEIEPHRHRLERSAHLVADHRDQRRARDLGVLRAQVLPAAREERAHVRSGGADERLGQRRERRRSPPDHLTDGLAVEDDRAARLRQVRGAPRERVQLTLPDPVDVRRRHADGGHASGTRLAAISIRSWSVPAGTIPH
jgi:hypothetical protein